MRCILLLFWILFSIELTAQISISYRFNTSEDSLFSRKNSRLFPENAEDSLSSLQILRGSIMALQKQNYLEASIDSSRWEEKKQGSKSLKQMTVYLHIGQPYKWAKLRNGNVPETFLSQVGYREYLLDGKTLMTKEIFDIEEKLLIYAENNGYPFAQVWLDSLIINKEGVSAALMMKTGQIFVFDSIRLEGFAKLSSSFLENYLDIHKKTLFSRAKVLKIAQRLAELPYLTERKPAKLTFTDTRTAVISLFLDAHKASRWDFLVGIQPTTVGGIQKFAVTFNGVADFQNILGRGERLYANFENVRPQSPRFNVKMTYPYILNTPFAFDGAFDLYKKDTSYIETHIKAGGQYLLRGSNYIKLYWQNYKAHNLIINSKQIINSKILPSTLDITTNMVGVEFSTQTLDYRFNPRRGFLILLRGGAGIRQVQKNTDIVALKDPNNSTYDFERLYDTITLKNFQYKIDVKTDYFIPLLRRSAVKIGFTGGFLLTAAPISVNEQYRLGGNRLIRGFDEESLLATRYMVGTLEYRLLIGRNSYIYTFGDAAYIENITQRIRNFDTPLSFGAGITFETKVGLFGVTLAVGQQQGNSLDFRNVKTHFGYMSIF